MNNLTVKKTTRRSFLKGAALLASIAIVPLMVSKKASAAAAAKSPQAAMQYQDHPKGDLKCANCVQFIPGKSAKANGSCKIVDGVISPQGYCIGFAAKA